GGGDRDAHARGDLHFVPTEADRLAEHLADTFSHLDGRRRALESRQQDRELVAAHARDDVTLSYAALQLCRHGDEQVVAGVVTKTVVHVLEAVEVEEQHRDEVTRSAAAAA